MRMDLTVASISKQVVYMQSNIFTSDHLYFSNYFLQIFIVLDNPVTRGVVTDQSIQLSNSTIYPGSGITGK